MNGAGEPLSGHTALVTGAGKKIGRAIAVGLSRQGASVTVNVGSNLVAGDEVVREIADAGGRAIAVQADVSSPTAVAEMVARTREQLGPITILVCNAAIRPAAALTDITPEAWNRVLAVNLSGAFYCIREVVEDMRAAGFGRIVAIGGVVTSAPSLGAQRAHIAASKAGLEGLVHSVSRELGRDGITANLISPGPVVADGPPERLHAPRADWIPVGGRLGTPEDIASLCAFLCTPGAGYVNGQVIVADGGGTLMPTG